jgi:type II secretion system protein J
MNARPHHPPLARGFTLLEVLLAVVVFAGVLAAIHGVFYGALRLRNKSAAALEATLPLQQTLATIRRDLENIVPPGGVLSGTLQSLLISSDSSAQRSPDFYTASGTLSELEPWGEIQRVAYFLAQPTNNTSGLDLYRSASRNLLPVLTEEVEDQWLMSGVQSLAFAFYDGTQWRNSWDSTTEVTPLPLAIKLQLQLVTPEPQQFSRQRAPVELIVPLMAQGSTNATTQASGGEQ